MTQPTTLQLARDLIRWTKEEERITVGYESIINNLPGVDIDREEQIRQAFMDAREHIHDQQNHVFAEYKKRIPNWKWEHTYRLQDIAYRYAWK